jgi:O-antigen/teichoic acid export membrane protein
VLKLRRHFLDFVKGDLFATAASFAAQIVIRLGASLVLTRVLKPEAYGIVAIVVSIGYVVTMLADIAVTMSLVRHEHGDQSEYLNTAWTLRLGRSLLNAILMFWAAPLLGDLYHAPLLTHPLRVYSLWFVLEGFESMSFPVAIRRRNSRIIVYSELVATAATTAFTLLYCYYTRDYMGMVYGMLLNRLILTVMSYGFYRDVRPRLMVNREAARQLLRYTRYALPSSFITLVLNQFDKMIFLRLFDLRLLGVFSLAGNIASPIEALIWRISELVLYPRCAHDFRTAPNEFSMRYYTHNTGVFLCVLTLPAVVGGAAQLLIGVLYDPRYAQAGMILQAFMLRASLLALASPAEHMLIAAGQLQVQLHGNIFRAISMIVGTVAGFYLAGFLGFIYGIALSGLAPLLYYLWLQRRKGLLIVRYELYRVGLLLATWGAASLASRLLLNLLPLRTRI